MEADDQRNPEWMFGELTVEEYTTPSPFSVGRRTPVAEVAQLMRDHGFRHVPVIEGGEPLGIISDGDVKLAASFKGSGDLCAEDVMSGEVYTVEPTAPLEEVVFHMSEQKLGSALVMSETEDFVGIFTVTDALNALIELLRSGHRKH